MTRNPKQQPKDDFMYLRGHKEADIKYFETVVEQAKIKMMQSDLVEVVVEAKTIASMSYQNYVKKHLGKPYRPFNSNEQWTTTPRT